MKKYLIISLLALAVNNSFAVEKEPIVDVNVVEEFGIWRVYNSGGSIYIVDSIKGRVIQAWSDGYFGYFPLDGGRYWYSPSNVGTNSINSGLPYPQEISHAARTIATTAHLQDGIFGFQDSNFQVSGDTMFIYDKDNYNDVTKDASLKMVLNKYSNRVLVEGSETTSNFEPTIVVNPSDVAGPAKILGDCNANYNPETGILSIPCFSIGKEKTVHQINLNQIPETLDFSADLQTFIRVQ